MNTNRLETEQLKEVCKLERVSWAIWGQSSGPTWHWGVDHGLSKTRRVAFEAYLQNEAVQTWLAGALSTGRTRSRSLDRQSPALGCQRLYLFPNQSMQTILLVGADQLSHTARAFFRILARSRVTAPSSAQIAIPLATDLFGDLDVELSYDLASTLERILMMLVRALPCDAAGIAMRYGGQIRLETIWNLPQNRLGWQMALDDSPTLSKLVSDRQVVRIADRASQEICPFLPVREDQPGSWAGVPLVVGRRVIGIACFVSQQVEAFSPQDLQQAASIASYLAPSIETSVALAEASRHLEKFALLNEIASAASVGEDTTEVARRIVQRLRRVFNTDLISILLLTPDGRFLREFGQQADQNNPLVVPVESSLSGQVVETGLPVRIGEPLEAPRYLAVTPGVQSELAVPLKYRGTIIGVLNLESQEANAFSLRDEQLLVVMASQLAGLIENVRLYEETRKRVRNLELIHQVVEEVVGLGDIREIARRATELMADYFSYELAAIMLLDENDEELVLMGVGGTAAHGLQVGHRQHIDIGIVGRVVQSGKSWLVNDVSEEPLYFPGPGLNSGAEMCVPLRDGEYITGVINVERSRKDAFVENDLLALEALAGVLSSVISNARSYQRLRANLRRLQAVRETALDISADLELDTLLERVTERAREMVEADGAELGLVNEQRQVVQIKVSLNPWDGYKRGLDIPFGQGVAGSMAVTGESLVVADYLAWENRLDLNSRPPFTSVAGVPLKYKGQVIGTLTISHDRAGRGFDREDIELLELLAPQVAIFVRNARLYQELQEYMQAERRAKDHLVRSARLAAVGELAAGVAHELNNPLTTVAGFVELVLEDLPQDHAAQEDLSLVLREAHRAREVVRRLLDFSRPGDGFRVRSDVNELVEDVLALIQHLARTSGIDVQLSLWHDLPWVQVDRDQIKQVILNLLHNALLAMPTGGQLQVETSPAHRDKEPGVQISVRDTGLGIAPADMDRLFEPFFTTRPPGKGTGLGLSVSYGIISEHGGSIEVESELGQGSCFIIWLPVQSKRALL